MTDAPVCYRHPDRETWVRCQRCERPICPDCMVPAAVGHQCPECVKQGRKETRSGRTAYGGEQVRNPQLTTFGLIALNVAVWLGVLASGGDNGSLLQRLALLPSGRCEEGNGYFPGVGDSGLCSAAGHHWVPGVSDGAVWQVLTSAFTHVEIWHIGFNMVALFFLGPMLEVLVGRARFLAIYLVSALTGSALVMLAAGEQTQTLGASGAIFGLMGALLVVGWRIGANLQQIGTWLVLNLVFTFYAGASISWQGHIGGLLGGAAAAAVVVLAPRQNRSVFQWAGLAAVAVVAVVLIGVRAATL